MSTLLDYLCLETTRKDSCGSGGQASATQTNGNISVSQPGNGISIYKGGSSTPSLILTVKAVQKILK